MIPRDISARYQRLGMLLPSGTRVFTERQLVAFAEEVSEVLVRDALLGVINELARHANELSTIADNLRRQYEL
jgi:predicted metal-dependent hydrolase